MATLEPTPPPGTGRWARPSTVPGFTQGRLLAVLGSLFMAVFLASLETTVVSTALPTIAGQFNAFERFPWVVTAYIVTSTIAIPMLGKLSDLYGRRRVFQTTMTVFCIGSLLCGLAQSMNQLIAARAFQGFGGGGIQALAFAIIGEILPPRERGRYIGYFTIGFAGAGLAGPLIGGFVIDRWTWPWIFLINVPLAGAVTLVTGRSLRLPFVSRRARIDWAGAALFSLGLGSLILALELGRTGWWRTPVVVLFAVSLASIAAFVRQEQRAPEPMIPLRLFRTRALLVSCMLGLLAGWVSYGTSSYLPLYFQDALFVAPTMSGLRILPTFAGVVIMSFAAGRLIARTGRYRLYPIIGAVLGTVGLLGVARIDGGTRYVTLVVPMFFVGCATGVIFTTSSIAGQNAIELGDMGIATATMMFFRTLGGSLGNAVNGTVLNSTVRSKLPDRLGVSPAAAGDLIRAPKQIRVLPASTRSAVIDTIASAVSRVYWVAAAMMAIALVWAFVLPELPLRAKAGITDALVES